MDWIPFVSLEGVLITGLVTAILTAVGALLIVIGWINHRRAQASLAWPWVLGCWWHGRRHCHQRPQRRRPSPLRCRSPPPRQRRALRPSARRAPQGQTRWPATLRPRPVSRRSCWRWCERRAVAVLRHRPMHRRLARTSAR